MARVEQLELMAPTARPAPQPVSLDVIYKQPSLLKAIELAAQVSGLEAKEIYMPLGIKKDKWSKMMSGKSNFPTNKYGQFMDIVGNDIPLIWLAFSRGKGLHDLEDAKDARIRVLEEQLRATEHEKDTIVKYIEHFKRV